jgi:hypothetical protein
MKFSVWDALTILTLMGLCVVGIIVVSIFANPASAFNPFPPPTLPVSIVLPSSTPTPFYMPPTWTPIGGENGAPIEKVATQTPLPTATGFVLPSFTPTFTVTPSPTHTETPTATEEDTETPEPTNTKKPTRTPTQISSYLSIDDFDPDTSVAGEITIVIPINNTGSNTVSGVTFKNTFKSKTVSGISWTVARTGGATASPTHGSSANFSTSLSFPHNSSVTITIKVKTVKSPTNESVQISIPDRYDNNGTEHRSKTISW